MFLRRLEIIGFRGINRLSMTLQPNMVLIGENAWGKTSLFDALSLIFNHQQTLYRFCESDFHIAQKDGQRTKQITLLFTFAEHFPNERHDAHNYLFQRFFIANGAKDYQIYLRVNGSISADNQIHTDYAFLDQDGREIQTAKVSELVKALIARFPIYSIRHVALHDSRHLVDLSQFDPQIRQQPYYDKIQAFSLLIQYYYFNHEARQFVGSKLQDLSALWGKVKELCYLLRLGDRELRQRLFRLFSQLFVAEGALMPVDGIHPIVLFEDPDARLHPRLVAIMWELISYLPLQRITTTNSVELLSQVALHEICRLVRTSNEIKTYRLSRYSLSKQALRRLTFHIHYNRSLALFASSWILVEGETEVWLLSALAEQMGLNLELEGIKIVEFAQCGLSPLIKYVKAMGIEWHVLADGDSAGKKYADTVRSLLDKNETLLTRLTLLPKRDIEHFLYFSGFEHVFVRLARWQDLSSSRPASRIIQQAIKKSSKPDLAIALAGEIERQGKHAIPILLQRMFRKVLNLTKG